MVRPALGGSCACAKMVEERVRVVRCGGSRLNFRRAVFSADSKYAGGLRADGADGAPRAGEGTGGRVRAWAPRVRTRGSRGSLAWLLHG